MKNRVWKFQLLDEQHIVEFLQEGFLGTKLIIKVDGQELDNTQFTVNLQRTSIAYLFHIGEHRCLLRKLGEISHWDFYVDGRLIY
jgi:hypothetical protein